MKTWDLVLVAGGVGVIGYLVWLSTRPRVAAVRPAEVTDPVLAMPDPYLAPAVLAVGSPVGPVGTVEVRVNPWARI